MLTKLLEPAKKNYIKVVENSMMAPLVSLNLGVSIIYLGFFIIAQMFDELFLI